MQTRPLALSALLLVPSLAAAQPAPCFDPMPLDPWIAESVDAPTGAARPLTGDLEVELCSVSDGPGELKDSYQAVVRGIAGDAAVTTTVTALDPEGFAGLVFAHNVRHPDTAAFHVGAERIGEGPEVLVRAGVRAMDTGASTPLDGALLDAVLPVTLRLERAAGVMTATLVADALGPRDEVVLSVPVAGTDLAVYGSVGLLQAGPALDAPSHARFTPPELDVAFVPPAVVECVSDTVMPQSGGAFSLTGFALDHVTSARLGGADLPIARATEAALLLTRPPAPVPTVGALTLTSGPREVPTGRVLATGGRPWIRGDVDADGDVDLDDLRALRSHMRNGTLPDCRATPDVNADGVVDAADDTHLARWVNGRRGAAPPAAPFPVAGIVRGVPACGLAAGPVVRRVVQTDGLALTGPLAAGDVVRIAGTNLPTAPEVRFGPVAATVLPGATSSRMDVRIGAVPAAGAHCLALGLGAAPAEGDGIARFGATYGNPQSERPDLCPNFTASRSDFASIGAPRADGTIFLPFDPQRFEPTRRLRVSVSLGWPLVEGENRGPRTAAFWYAGPSRSPGDTAPVTYAQWLSDLAKTTAEALGAGDDCDCEAEVLPEPALGGLSIRPCHQTAPVPPPPPPPAGTVPNGLPLKPISGGLGAASAFAPPPAPSCEALGPDASALRRAWCNFAQVTAVREAYDPNDVDDSMTFLGLPLWEGFRPMVTLLADGVPQWVVDPRLQPRDHKYIKVETPMANRLISGRYFNDCAIAARAHHCHTLAASWMPALPEGSRIVKAFWVPEGSLPASADPNSFYSWLPPADGNQPQPVRQYLVGMHVSVGTGESAGGTGYLTWSTFWSPVAPGETHTRDGRPIGDVYNPNCFVGGAEERPAELAGTPYAGWHACVQTGKKQHCGNPWGPANECVADLTQDQGCERCHVQRGTIQFPEGAQSPAEPWMAMAWLTVPSSIGPAAQACMDLILAKEAEGKAPYEHLADCQDF